MKLDNLGNALRKHGLTVVEWDGWQGRGYAGQDLTEIRGVLWHHTATNRAAFNTSSAPTARLCRDGRSDLPGPLCQIVFARDGAVHLIATGVGNHAGMGSAPGIPANAGNYYLIGIEMESSGIAPWDWTEDMIRVAPYLGAALEIEYLQHLPPDQRLQIGHYEYSSQGKIDPAGWPGGMDGLRAQINAKIVELQAPAPKTTTTTTTQKENDVTARELWSYVNTKVNGTKDAYALLTETVRTSRTILARLDGIEKRLEEVAGDGR